MKSALALVLLLLTLTACASLGAARAISDPCASVEFDPPRAKGAGSVLPHLRVEGNGSCQQVEIEVLAFEDADLDGQPDDGRAHAVAGGWLRRPDAFLEFRGVELRGKAPMRWQLAIEADGERRVSELGIVR